MVNEPGDLGSEFKNKAATFKVNQKFGLNTNNAQNFGDADFIANKTVTEEKLKFKAQTNKPKYSTSEEGKIYQRQLQRNILHDFASYNAVITLGVLDIEEVNFPHVIQKNGLRYPIAQTAGKQGKEVTAFADAGFNLEYLIDNLEIHGVVAPNVKTRHTQATKITFEVHEPFSLGVFFQTMRIQAARAYNNDFTVDHLKVPYCLYIEFIGTKDDGESYTIPELRRVIPIGIQMAEVRANKGGAIYQVTAYPWNEYVFRNTINTIDENITLSGSTVYEMLQSGENSLMNYLNSLHKQDAKGKPKAKDPKNPVIPPSDNTVIFFPTEFGTPEDYSVSDETLTSLNQSRSGPAQGDFDDWNFGFAERKQDTVVEKILKNGNNETVTVTNQYSRDQADGISVDQFVTGSNVFKGNEIGAAKITINENNLNQIGNVFSDWKTAYNPKTKIYKRSNIIIDLTKQNVSFQKGTLITDIIENIILLSDYGAKLGKRFTSMDKSPEKGFVKWFRIHPQMFQLKDDYIFHVTKRHPTVNVLNIIPYRVPETSFIAPGEYAAEFNYLRSLVERKYEYIYTGRNEDILDFDILYRFAFFKQVPSVYNKTANTSVKGDNESLENSTANKQDAKMGLKKDAAPTSYNNPRIIGSENLRRSEGTGSESPELKVARSVNENIVNSDVDLFELNLRIVGDTYFLPNSGNGNYVAKVVDRREIEDADGNRRTIAAVFSNADGEASLIGTQILVEVDFRTPIDINAQGDMEFTNLTQSDISSSKLGEFSGVYRVQSIISTFRQGKFEQEVKMLRPQSMELTQPEDASNNKNDKTDHQPVDITPGTAGDIAGEASFTQLE